MNALESTRRALTANPDRFIHYELGTVGQGLKGCYFAVMEGSREIMQTTREATEQLARSGIIQAGSFNAEQRAYRFSQVAA